MLKTRAVERFIGQAVNNGVIGVILFNKEGWWCFATVLLLYFGISAGQVVAHSGDGFNPNVYAALTSNLWETFDRQRTRDRLREVEVRGATSTLIAMRVANMVIALISEPNVPSAICKAKLNQLAAHLDEPLGVLS